MARAIENANPNLGIDVIYEIMIKTPTTYTTRNPGSNTYNIHHTHNAIG